MVWYWWNVDLFCNAGTTLTTANWNFVAATFVAGVRKFYINGVVCTDNPAAPNFRTTNADNKAAIGMTDPPYEPIGNAYIDSVLVWDVGLSPTEVAALQAAGRV